MARSGPVTTRSRSPLVVTTLQDGEAVAPSKPVVAAVGARSFTVQWDPNPSEETEGPLKYAILLTSRTLDNTEKRFEVTDAGDLSSRSFVLTELQPYERSSVQIEVRTRVVRGVLPCWPCV